MVPSLPLLSCESSVSVKENPDRRKKKKKKKIVGLALKGLTLLMSLVSFSIYPFKNMREALFFWCLQGDIKKTNSGMEWVNLIKASMLRSQHFLYYEVGKRRKFRKLEMGRERQTEWKKECCYWDASGNQTVWPSRKIRIILLLLLIFLLLLLNFSSSVILL